MVDVIKHSGGNIANDEGMETFVLDGRGTKVTMNEKELKDIATDVEHRLMGVKFVLCADRHRFGRLIESIRNDFIEGEDRYPTSVNDAYHHLTNYTYDPRLGQREVGGGEISFVNAEGKGNKPRNIESVTCHRCKQTGHYANKCDNERVDDVAPGVVEAKMAAQKNKLGQHSSPTVTYMMLSFLMIRTSS